MENHIKKYRKILLLAVVVILLFQLNTIALGAFELDYPSIPGAPTQGPHTGSPHLGKYILYGFIFILMTAGVIGVISIVISGMQILLFAGSPAAISAARERIIWSIGGIILLAFSVVLIRTINPDILNVRKIDQPLATGLYYKESTTPTEDNPQGIIYSLVPQVAYSTFNSFDDDISLFNHCNDPAKDKPILVWFYNEPFLQVNFEDELSYLFTGTIELLCGDSVKLNPLIASLRWDYKKSGAYFYIKKDCQGLSSNAYQNSNKITDFDSLGIGEDLGTSDKLTVRSFKIVNGTSPRARYSVILNKNPEHNGLCTEPYIWEDEGESQCYNLTFSQEIKPNTFQDVSFDPRFAYVLNFNPEWKNKNKTGVSLFSDHFATEIPADDITGPIDPTFGITPTIKGIKDHYTTYNRQNPDPTHGNPDNLLNPSGLYTLIPNIGVPLNKECTKEDLDANPDPNLNPNNQGLIQQVILAATRRTCLKRIEILNPYYVILYGRNYFTGDDTCQIFNDYTRRSLNPKQEDILSAYRKLYRMDIIPRAQ